MGSSKTTPSPQPPVYRDEPELAETASMSSAVLLDDIDYADEDLPSYTDLPAPSKVTGPPLGQNGPLLTLYSPPTALPFATHDLYHSEHRTRFPIFSTDAAKLNTMIHEQASFPPSYFVQIHGSHTETRRNGNKESKDKVTDFRISINLTNLLVTTRSGGTPTDGRFELLADNKRGFRGTIVPRLKPNFAGVDEEDVSGILRLWCDKYVADPSKVKSFTLKREIEHHDTKKLEQLIRSAIQETNYRGHVSVDFPIQHQTVIVYSPGMINEWRITVWVRWVFYLTFLWIFAWPALFFMTSRYEVVKVVYPYADSEPGNDMTRKCTVMCEVEWFNRWQSAIKRAALARMQCKDAASLDEEYRRATEAADRRGELQGRQSDIPSTGNAFADGAFGLLGHGLRVAEGFNSARGWGYDC